MSSVVNLNPRPLLLVRQTGFANMYNLKKKNLLIYTKNLRDGGGDQTQTNLRNKINSNE